MLVFKYLSLIFLSSDKRLRSQGNSKKTSRLSNYSGRHLDVLDTHHSVFSRNSYYHDMHSIHPLARRPCSRLSGIPLTTLRAKSCSPRIEDLARPKIRRERFIRQGNFIHNFKQSVFFFFKILSVEYFDNITNYAYSGVKTTALTAQCSDRLVELAQPKKRSNSYILPRSVSVQALHPQRSDRIDDLAKPRHNIIIINSAWKNKKN